jgi:hypothetical protein
LAVVLGISGGTACVRVQSEMLVPVGKYQPVPAEEVRVFASEAEIRERGYD